MNKDLQTLDVDLRKTKTKSELNKLRSEGFVPGILYGEIDKNITLKQLYEISNIELHIYAVNYSKFELEDFSSVYFFPFLTSRSFFPDFSSWLDLLQTF